VGQGPKLTNNEQKLLVQLIDMHRAAGLQPPTVKECREVAARHQEAVPQLLALAEANGELVSVSSDFYLHRLADQGAQELLREKLGGSPGMTVSEIREALNTSRKYAVPYCEYLDRIGVTERRGDRRVLANAL
jgi:selenocysteine-specific elongation factor